MTFNNQTAPNNHDGIEVEWHGGPREQGGYAVARHTDGSALPMTGEEMLERVSGILGVSGNCSRCLEAGAGEAHQVVSGHGPV